VSTIPPVPDVVTVEPSGDTPIPPGKRPWLPLAIFRDLSTPDVPQGAYPLYELLCRASDGHEGEINIRETITDWFFGRGSYGPVISLRSRDQWAASADALARRGLLRRERTMNGGEHWTLLVFGSKREAPILSARRKKEKVS
jgi:hypothetical protein